MLTSRTNRRRFLGLLGLASAGAAGIALTPNVEIRIESQPEAAASA